MLVTVHEGPIRRKNRKYIYPFFPASIWFIFLYPKSISPANKSLKIFTRLSELKVGMVIAKAFGNIAPQNMMLFEQTELCTYATIYNFILVSSDFLFIYHELCYNKTRQQYR